MSGPELRHHAWCADPTVRQSSVPLRRNQTRWRCLGCGVESVVTGEDLFPGAGKKVATVRDEAPDFCGIPTRSVAVIDGVTRELFGLPLVDCTMAQLRQATAHMGAVTARRKLLTEYLQAVEREVAECGCPVTVPHTGDIEADAMAVHVTHRCGRRRRK